MSDGKPGAWPDLRKTLPWVALFLAISAPLRLFLHYFWTLLPLRGDVPPHYETIVRLMRAELFESTVFALLNAWGAWSLLRRRRHSDWIGSLVGGSVLARSGYSLYFGALVVALPPDPGVPWLAYNRVIVLTGLLANSAQVACWGLILKMLLSHEESWTPEPRARRRFLGIVVALSFGLMLAYHCMRVLMSLVAPDLGSR